MISPQQPRPTTPPVPAPPVVVSGAGGDIVVAGPGGNTYTITVPRTAQDLAALRERRSELSNQLTSAASRRAEIAKELTGADGATKAGLEQRMAVLDKRILQLESDIAETGQQLTSAPAGLIVASESPFASLAMDPDTIEKVSVMFTLFVLAPLAVGAAFLMFRRAMRPASRAERGDGERLERLENAVDAIAIEIERISEGQRFVTRLLTEAAPPPALSAGKTGQIVARRAAE